VIFDGLKPDSKVAVLAGDFQAVHTDMEGDDADSVIWVRGQKERLWVKHPVKVVLDRLNRVCTVSTEGKVFCPDPTVVTAGG